jgi:hypothetical protein
MNSLLVWALHSLRKSDAFDAFRIAILTRVVIFAIGLFAVLAVGSAQPEGLSPRESTASLPARWDASWYTGVAAGGYRWQPDERHSRLAFFPAYPLALRAVGKAVALPNRPVPWLWTGVALSVVFFGFALWYVGSLSESIGGKDARVPAMLLTATYPFALFHGQVYPESLFLLCSVAATYESYRGRPLRTGLWGLLAGLSRPTGVLVTLLVLPSALRQVSDSKNTVAVRVSWVIAMLGPTLGTVAYSTFVYFVTGDPLRWIHDQEGWGRVAANPVTVVRGVFQLMIENGLLRFVAEQPYDALNVGAFVVAAATIWPVARRLGWGPALFMACSLIAPLRVGGFPSMGRYTCVLFPAFIWWALRGRRDLLLPVVMMAMQGFLAALFFTDRPVF